MEEKQAKWSVSLLRAAFKTSFKLLFYFSRYSSLFFHPSPRVCVFYVCEVIGFVDWLDRGLIHMWEEFRNVYLLMSLIVLRWPCVVDRTLKSNYCYHPSPLINCFSLFWGVFRQTLCVPVPPAPPTPHPPPSFLGCFHNYLEAVLMPVIHDDK